MTQGCKHYPNVVHRTIKWSVWAQKVYLAWKKPTLAKEKRKLNLMAQVLNTLLTLTSRGHSAIISHTNSTQMCWFKNGKEGSWWVFSVWSLIKTLFFFTSHEFVSPRVTMFCPNPQKSTKVNAGLRKYCIKIKVSSHFCCPPPCQWSQWYLAQI